MAHDNLHCMYMAEQVAKAMAPEVVVATPLNIGVSEHHARRFAGQSMRSGGATAAAISGLSPAEICHLAGVKDVDWLSHYNRNHLSSRLRASRAVGL